MLKIIRKVTVVLDAFTDEAPEWSLSELVRHLDMPKGTMHHILSSLREAGWVVQNPLSRRYRLGTRLWQKGWTAVRHLGLHNVPRLHIQRLARETGETVHLSIIEPHDPAFVVYVDKIESDHPVRAYSEVGGRAPSYCVASGKAMLAFNQSLLDALLERPLEAYTTASITDPERLLEEMQITRRRGYSINYGEYREEVVGVASPIRDHLGQVFAAVGISGPAYRLPRKTIGRNAPLVVEIALRISEELGHLDHCRVPPTNSSPIASSPIDRQKRASGRKVTRI